MKAAASLAILLLLATSSSVEGKRLMKRTLADIETGDLYSTTELDDNKLEIAAAKEAMAQKEQRLKSEAEQKQRMDAKRKQEELDRKINSLKMNENKDDSLTLKMGDKLISIAGLADSQEYVQLRAEPKSKNASNLQDDVNDFISEETENNNREVAAAKKQAAFNEEHRKKMADMQQKMDAVKAQQQAEQDAKDKKLAEEKAAKDAKEQQEQAAKAQKEKEEQAAKAQKEKEEQAAKAQKEKEEQAAKAQKEKEEQAAKAQKEKEEQAAKAQKEKEQREAEELAEKEKKQMMPDGLIHKEDGSLVDPNDHHVVSGINLYAQVSKK